MTVHKKINERVYRKEKRSYNQLRRERVAHPLLLKTCPFIPKEKERKNGIGDNIVSKKTCAKKHRAVCERNDEKECLRKECDATMETRTVAGHSSSLTSPLANERSKASVSERIGSNS